MSSNNCVLRKCKKYNKISQRNSGSKSVEFWNIGFREGKPLTSYIENVEENIPKKQEDTEKKKRKSPIPHPRAKHFKTVRYGKGRKLSKVVEIAATNVNYHGNDSLGVVRHELE